MFDRFIVPMISPTVNVVGRCIARTGISANGITLFGLVMGLMAVPFLSEQEYGIALALIILNRISDGLDGAVARANGVSDFGGYLDIVADFIFYGMIPVGFALASPDNVMPAVWLLASFYMHGAAFLAFAIIAEKKGLDTEVRGKKSFFYLGGLAEGAETIAFFIAFCLFPDKFPMLACIFVSICFASTGLRIWQSKKLIEESA